ncbi:hypothetical protein H4R34_005467 [Dimargaris verticillata]|uniref:Queuosine 5'-phosphate N-glycosylase/hydrolase n=1 Tax=Dimargaris verticillata TaxID=2761393 RepID=A0A9W8B3I8_9FUNG|nr:hypothetical protein H4R34_005467 [Dimargaris verticillata]
MVDITPELVLKSCSELVGRHTKRVAIDSGAIDKFLSDIDLERFKKLSQGWISVPLRFDTPEDEVSFVATLDLLNFGSGYRTELHAACNRGAAETILYGCMSMHISQVALTASSLKQLTVGDVATYFGIPLLGDDVPHPTLPAVTISQPSPLRPLAQAITSTLVETGNVLEQQGYRSLGHFILDSTKRPIDASPDWQPSAVDLVQRLVKAFPAFQDYGQYENTTVYLIKKAQLLAADLNDRFKNTSSPVYDHFNFFDLETLTVFSDNVLPAVLKYYGIIKVHDSALLTSIKQLQPLSDADMWLLRAAAVAACDQIVSRCRDQADNQGSAEQVALAQVMTSVGLDHYLWHIGKDPEIRKQPRLVYKSTVYF